MPEQEVLGRSSSSGEPLVGRSTSGEQLGRGQAGTRNGGAEGGRQGGELVLPARVQLAHCRSVREATFQHCWRVQRRLIISPAHPRLLEEAMGVSSCSTGSTEPLDSDGLVAHNDQVQGNIYTAGFLAQCTHHNTVISSRV